MSSARLMVGIAVLALLAAASSDVAGQAIRPAAPVLSMEQARARSARIADVRYDLDLSLSSELPEYSGTVAIAFRAIGRSGDLTLDFGGGSVRSVVVNGEPTDGAYNGYYLTLPEDLLARGENTVAVAFSRPYSDDGTGLYRFRDPEDGRDYLYTDFEPYDQNRLFPSFDQPDLKARYTTRVTAPADWQVIANVRESAVRSSGDNRTWIFPETEPLSTYVYALHAGEYHVWQSRAGDIPLRLFARESLVPYVRPEDWFLPTRLGFAFYERYFDVPYPFGKYDQVIVPHFNSGAMENVAAVTFNEAYLSRGVVTRQDRRSITSVILHEMAHMWFGDLVTMDWWNGLWLNESFATVMAVIAMVEATEFDDEWQEAFRDTVRAYQADERETTHPIELPIPDTDSAFANFDRITYEKGSATLVQLMHLVGPEAFRRGVSEYLSTHAYGNTRIDDFLAAISESADIDLGDWARDWLLTPGTNAVEVELGCASGRIESLSLVQSAPAAWPVLRAHRTQLGLYYFRDSGVEIETVPATYSGERTAVTAARDLPCPDFVYANHGDWDFVRVRLEPSMLTVLREHLLRIDDAFARLMLWQSVWDLVVDARIPVTEYVDFALANLAAETNENATRQIVGAIQTSLSYLSEIDDTALRTVYGPRAEAALWSLVQASEPGSDRQLLFFDNYVAAAGSDEAIERLAAFVVRPETAPNGIELDQDRRWTLLGVLAARGHADAAALLAAERARDPSDEGSRRALAAEAGLPDAAAKTRWIDRLLDPNRTSNLAEFRAIAGGLFPRGQHALQLANADRLLDNVTTLNRTRDATFYSAYVGRLLAPVCSADYLEDLDRVLEDAETLHPIIVRGLKDSRFEVYRCLRIAALQNARN